jgi:hypothetical protein
VIEAAERSECKDRVNSAAAAAAAAVTLMASELQTNFRDYVCSRETNIFYNFVLCQEESPLLDYSITRY